MEIDRESLQLIMLRVLGVLLILVGFTMIAGLVRSQPGEHIFASSTKCARKQVEVRVMAVPTPPIPPAPPTLTF